MTSLRARLVLFGAILPTLLLAAAVLVAGAIFERLLLSGVDEAMRTQAAVEAVSLFDTPDGTPHVHLGRSPLGAEVDGIVSAIAIYDEHGARLAAHPDDFRGFPGEFTPSMVRDEAPHDALDARGSRIRLHTRVVRDPSGRPVVLWLGHELAHHTATLHAYYESAAAVVGLVAFLLLAVQLVQAARIHRRLSALVTHMERLREGDLDAALPADAGHDELAVLRGAIADATERLRTARRTQERLVSDAAHELRTPLATMKAAIEVTLRRERGPAELRETLEHVREEVDRLTQLSSALLDLAALRAREPERVDLDLVEIVDKATASARRAAEAREVALDVRGPGELPVRGSPREIRQALDNLLSNAISHTPSGSRIEVTIERAPHRARVIVRDGGEGIPETERTLVFEPFHRGQNRDASVHPRGQGLGLAIVRDVAVRHGGRAYVVDEAREGAAIAFELATAE
ncbi:MAG: HAMP domain-containing sensor histidine kinase [Sandaracinus sp.]